jgi:uncharacterized membrane protein
MNLPEELWIFFTAALPVSELRGAIPLGLKTFEMPVFKTYLISVAGNFFPVIPILIFLEPVSGYLRRFPKWERFFNWLYGRTKRRAEVVQKYEALGLMLFVSIPLPITGAWTGCVAASVCGIRLKYALPAIFCGILLAGAVVTALVQAGIELIKLF